MEKFQVYIERRQMKKKVIKAVLLLLAVTLTLNAQVNTEILREEEKNDDHFKLKLGLALALYKGNTNLFWLDSNLRLDYKRSKYTLFLEANLAYGEKQGESHLNKGFVHIRGIRELTKRFMLEVFVQEEFNRFIRLKERNLLGGGIRLSLIRHKNKKKNIDIDVTAGVGLMYEKERYDKAGEGLDKADASRMKSTNYFSFDIQVDKFTLDSITYFQFNTAGENSTRVYSDIQFLVRLSKVLSYTAGLNYRYDSNPAPTVKNYDIQITNGLTVILK
jgi:hypothetical protein